MRYKVTRQSKTYETEDEGAATCDMCGGPIRIKEYGYETEIAIQAKIGDIYEEDCRSVEEFDCCLKCWHEKVKPALVALGGRLYTYEADVGRTRSMLMKR